MGIQKQPPELLTALLHLIRNEYEKIGGNLS